MNRSSKSLGKPAGSLGIIATHWSQAQNSRTRPLSAAISRSALEWFLVAPRRALRSFSKRTSHPAIVSSLSISLLVAKFVSLPRIKFEGRGKTGGCRPRFYLERSLRWTKMADPASAHWSDAPIGQPPRRVFSCPPLSSGCIHGWMFFLFFFLLIVFVCVTGSLSDGCIAKCFRALI